MRGFAVPDVTITAAARAMAPVPMCRVDGVIGKEIHFALWLPDDWNGKFVMGGQGGFAGQMESQAHDPVSYTHLTLPTIYSV